RKDERPRPAAAQLGGSTAAGRAAARAGAAGTLRERAPAHLELPPHARAARTPADPAPRGGPAPGSAGARAARARALARARRVREVAAGARVGAAVGVLRGTAHGQWASRRAPRAVARVQGHLPALQDDARLPRGAQGRLGLSR